ncbi:MAG: hypothetical protein P8Z35_24235 [Ignavibacteriaceae bacterium]
MAENLTYKTVHGIKWNYFSTLVTTSNVNQINCSNDEIAGTFSIWTDGDIRSYSLKSLLIYENTNNY